MAEDVGWEKDFGWLKMLTVVGWLKVSLHDTEYQPPQFST